MELFEKRNFVFLMAIFLLFMMVSSVSAIDAEDAVIGEDSAIEDLNLISSDTGEEISVGNAGSDNSVLYPEDDDSLSTGDADEKLSSELIADEDSAMAPRDTKEKLSMENTVDDSSQNVLKASADDEVLGATTIHVGPDQEYKTINAALSELTNANVDYEIIIDSGTYSHTSTMNIGNTRNFRSLVIRAADGADVTISGNNAHGIFSISHQNVAFKGMTFANGTGSGGALAITASHVSVDNCSFIHCGASNRQLEPGNNGVLGGAIHIGSNWGGSNIHDFNITNSIFDDCFAQVGGCIRTETQSTDVWIYNCNFTNNHATKHGAVTCLYGDGVLVENCRIENNTACSGAGLQFHTANSIVRNCTFIGNNATGVGMEDDHAFLNKKGYGGAIGLVYNSNDGVTIEDCEFINNSAVTDGGAIHVQGNGGGANITGCNFTNNSATDGGAIKIQGRNTTIEDCTFVGNNATKTDGGAININGTGTVINNATIENNTATCNGGGIFINGTNTVITDSEINGNNASVNGGGAYILGSNAKITNTAFDSNNALPAEDNMNEGLGGSIYVAGNNGNITDCNFTNNTGRNGSAIYVNPTNQNNKNYINNCDFVENQAWSYWMPIVYNDTHVEVNITGGNNILNAIYNNGPNTSIFIDGANPVLGWEASDNGTKIYQDVREAYQDIEVAIYDTQGHIVYNETHKTGLGGNVTFELTEHSDSDAWFFVLATHLEDTYYKEILNGTACDLKPNVTVSNVTMYEGNTSAQPVIVILADESAHAITVRGNISVYVDNGTEILIANGSTKTGFFSFNEETYFKEMAVGDYPIIAKFTYVDRIYDHGRWVNVTKTINGTGNLHILPYEWELTKTIIAVNDVPYEEGMEIHVNDNVTFNITVSNKVDADITDLKITDLSTDNLTYVKYVNGTEGLGWEFVGNGVWNLDNLPAQGNSSLFVTFEVINNGTSINVANASILDGTKNKSANVSLSANYVVSLEITKMAEPSEVFVGEDVTFTITVTNTGKNDATNTVITDELNTDVFEFVECSAGGEEKDGVVTWNVGTLTPGQEYVVTVTVTVKEAGTFNNTAVAVCDENETKTNDTAEIKSKSVILEITKEASEYELVVGETVTFTITVTNNGKTDATDVVIYDVLPEEFEYIDGTGSFDENTRNITWNIEKLASDGGTTTVTFNAKAILDGSITNIAHTFAKENETDIEASTDVITIQPNVVLDITKVSNVTEVVIGDIIEFTISVTNNGLSKATEVCIWDILPDAFEYVAGADSYDENTRNLTWTIDKLASNGGSVNVSFTAKAIKAGDFVNVAYANAKENETPVDNSTDKITVKKLHLIITINNYVTYPGSDVTVEITVVDEKGNPFTGTLNIEVADPVSTDSLPVHTVGASDDEKLGATTTTADINNGKGSFTYSVPEDAEDGTTYEVTGTTEETDEYYAAEGTGYIDVEKLETNTTVSNASGAPGETVTLDVEVTTEDGEPFNGEVTVNGPDGFSTTVTITDGKGSFDWTIPEDAENGTEYEFTATFDGNSKYFASNGTGIVDVLTEEEEPEEEPEEDPEEDPEEPEEEPEEPVEENTVQPAPMLKTGNPLIALLATIVFLGIGLKRREDE